MLENLYENIGGKIKSWAKWIFIIEAIGAVIAGFVLMCTASDFDDLQILWGLLTMILGPCVALVSTWILYAFGELVEKTCDNENNTRQILKKLDVKTTVNNATFIKNNECDKKTTNTPKTSSTHKWRCDGCGNMRTQNPCEYCGKE